MAVTGPSSQTVVPGSSITYQVLVTPLYGTYAGPVSFAVNGLPPGATATFSPSSIAANGGPQTITVTIQTAPATAAQHSTPRPASKNRTAPFALALLVMLGIGSLRRRGRALRRLLGIAALFAAGTASLVLSGCGGGGNGFFLRAPQNYTVTVTATSANLQHTATFTLNVQ